MEVVSEAPVVEVRKPNPIPLIAVLGVCVLCLVGAIFLYVSRAHKSPFPSPPPTHTPSASITPTATPALTGAPGAAPRPGSQGVVVRERSGDTIVVSPRGGQGGAGGAARSPGSSGPAPTSRPTSEPTPEPTSIVDGLVDLLP